MLTDGTTSRMSFPERGRRIGAAAIAGFVCGGIVGGLGGRLAMLVLRLTSDPSLHGLETDDGFTIGIVSSATMFLVIFTAFLGILGGLAYLVVRPWLPTRFRSAVFGSLTGVVGGAMVIRPGGLDFTLIEPRWLAISLFLLVPAAFGAAVTELVERWLPRASASGASRAWLAGLAVAALPMPILLRGPIGPLVLVAGVLAGAIGLARPGIRSLLDSAPVVWAGRACLLGVGVVAGASLASDISEIL